MALPWWVLLIQQQSFTAGEIILGIDERSKPMFNAAKMYGFTGSRNSATGTDVLGAPLVRLYRPPVPPSV